MKNVEDMMSTPYYNSSKRLNSSTRLNGNVVVDYLRLALLLPLDLIVATEDLSIFRDLVRGEEQGRGRGF